MQRTSKNCPAQRLDLESREWRNRVYTMLAFCVACHVGTVAAVAAMAFR